MLYPRKYEWSVALAEARAIGNELRRGRSVGDLRARIDSLGIVVRRNCGPSRLDMLDSLRVSCSSGSALLGRKRLLEFFAAKLLGSDAILDALGSAGIQPEFPAREKLSLAMAVSSLMTSLLEPEGTNGPLVVEVNAGAVVHLLVEYLRRQLDMDVAIDIEGALRSFGRVEPALYLWRDAYRDSLLHAVDVCLLGWMLLEAQLPGGKGTFGDHVTAMLDIPINRMYWNWFLAALCHDVGYAVAAIQQAVTHVGYLKSPYMEQLRHRTEEAMKSVGRNIKQAVREHVDTADIDGLDHGVLGFLHVRHTLEKAFPDASGLGGFRPACQAILKHNLSMDVDAACEPMSALLILCDELQEWERPRVSRRKFAARSRELTAGRQSEDLPSATILESLELVGLEIAGEQWGYTRDALQCVLTYKPPEVGRFLPQRVCLDKCHSLQRVNLSAFPFRLGLTLINQFIKVPSTDEWGFEALTSYARQHPGLGLLPFVNGRVNGPAGGVKIIDVSRSPGNIEELSVSLEDLNRLRPLPRKHGVDWDDFRRWSLAPFDPYELEPRSLLSDDAW